MASTKVATSQDPDLGRQQANVAGRYQKLEELLLRLAEMEAAENPERAALLKRAAKLSRDRFILDKLRQASSMLESERLQDAVKQQTSATKELQGLLKLLLTEDRGKRIRDEKQRISKVVKELKRLERAQRSTRARTENGGDTGQLADEQESIKDRGKSIAGELSDEEESGDSDASDDQNQTDDSSRSQSEQAESQDSDSKDSDGGESSDEKSENGESNRQDPEPGDSTDGNPSGKESNPSEDSSGDGDQQDADQRSDQQGGGEKQGGQPSESESPGSQGQQSPGSQPQSGQPQSGQSQSGKQQQQQPQSPQQQAEGQIEEALEAMREAKEELDKSQREGAVEQQRIAEERLRLAIDQLEQILRQLREEEMKRELAKLESRLRQMAAAQAKILDETIALAATPKSQRNRQTDLKSGNLSFEEKKITLDADRALLLLREEGSSVAFPEVISQIRGDTIRIATRLAETKIDLVTQGMQEDVLAALEEMIEALKKAQQDLEQQQQEQGQQRQQAGQQGEPPLVQAIAELKLLRTMEKRIKSTTQRYSQLIDAEETSGDEVIPLLKNLADRQSRLYRVTRDLVMKRND